MFTQFRVQPFTTWLKQQQFVPIVLLLLHSPTYTILIVRIILFTRNLSSHKTDWIRCELPLPVLSCLLYCRVSSLMNSLEEECVCLREISTNVNKLFTLLLLVYFVYSCSFSVVVVGYLLVYSLSYTALLLLPVYFFIPFFNTDVAAVFLFIRWSCLQAHYFCFLSFHLSFQEHHFHFRNNSTRIYACIWKLLF